MLLLNYSEMAPAQVVHTDILFGLVLAVIGSLARWTFGSISTATLLQLLARGLPAWYLLLALPKSTSAEIEDSRGGRRFASRFAIGFGRETLNHPKVRRRRNEIEHTIESDGAPMISFSSAGIFLGRFSAIPLRLLIAYCYITKPLYCFKQ